MKIRLECGATLAYVIVVEDDVVGTPSGWTGALLDVPREEHAGSPVEAQVRPGARCATEAIESHFRSANRRKRESPYQSVRGFL